MKFPWISRFLHESILAAKSHEISLLETQVDYWREKCEKEQERADRAVDNVLASAGREVISAPAVEAYEKQSKAAEEMRAQTEEIFADVAKSILADGENDGEITPEVASIADRLAKLRLLPHMRKEENASTAS